jgi:hypothetical protein
MMVGWMAAPDAIATKALRVVMDLGSIFSLFSMVNVSYVPCNIRDKNGIERNEYNSLLLLGVRYSRSLFLPFLEFPKLLDSCGFASIFILYLGGLEAALY